MPTLPASAQSLSISTFDRRLRTGQRSCDLSKLRFVDAYGLTGLACALVAAFDAGVRATITYPNEPQMREHLARMGLRDLLRALGYDDALPQMTSIDRPDVLLPLSKIDRVFAAEQLSSLLHEQLRDQAAPQILEAALEGLWELAANAVEHSGAAALIMGQVHGHGDPPHHHNRLQVVIGMLARASAHRSSTVDATTPQTTSRRSTSRSNISSRRLTTLVAAKDCTQRWNRSPPSRGK